LGKGKVGGWNVRQGSRDSWGKISADSAFRTQQFL